LGSANPRGKMCRPTRQVIWLADVRGKVLVWMMHLGMSESCLLGPDELRRSAAHEHISCRVRGAWGVLWYYRDRVARLGWRSRRSPRLSDKLAGLVPEPL